MREKITGRLEDAQKISITELPGLLTVKEAADLLRVAPLTLKRWGNRGVLGFSRINTRGDRRYKRDDLIKFLEESEE